MSTHSCTPLTPFSCPLPNLNKHASALRCICFLFISPYRVNGCGNENLLPKCQHHKEMLFPGCSKGYVAYKSTLLLHNNVGRWGG